MDTMRIVQQWSIPPAGTTRRAALRTLGSGVAAAVVATVSPRGAESEGTPSVPPVQPDLFELTGPEFQVIYSAGAGTFQMTDRAQQLTHTFTGEEIRVLETEIGRMVTVTVEEVPDLQTVTLTLLLPTFNLGDTEIAFETQAILTVHHTTIGGPQLVEGPLQTYQAVMLRGTARLDHGD